MGNTVVGCCSESSSTQASEDAIKLVKLKKRKERDYSKGKVSISDSVQSHEPTIEDQSFMNEYRDNPRRDKIRSNKSFQKIDDFKKKPKKFGLDNFQIQGVLGKGGFGVVYLAQLKSNILQGKKQQYAIKCVFKELLQRKHAFEQAKDQKIIAMSGCSFIVSLIMCFQDEYRLYFVMEYAGGGDTFGLINTNINKFADFMDLGETAVRFIAGCVVLGLEFIHEHGYMYRDLKPENIMVFGDGYVKLTDFGLAKKEKIGEHSKTVTGTTLYQAPEMVLQRGYDKKIDLWALGVYLYQMSNYCPPFETSQIKSPTFQKICLEAEANRVWVNPKISRQLKDLIQKLLKFNPEQRLGAKDWNEIKSHPFFNNFDWQALKELKMESPLKELVRKYPTEVRNENMAKVKPDPSVKIESATKVQGWSYYGKYTQKM